MCSSRATSEPQNIGRQRKAVERCGKRVVVSCWPHPKRPATYVRSDALRLLADFTPILQCSGLDPRTCPSRNSFAKALRYFRGNSVQIPSRVCQHSLPSQRSCRGASALLTRMLIGEVEQSTDALGGRGMAAKQAHRIMPECRHRHWRRAVVMALQLVECGDERP